MQERGQKEVKTGTTTVGIQYENGVVLATEKRASAGYQVAGKNTKKVFQVDDRIGITTAGSVGDVQTIVRYLKAETNLFKYKKEREMKPRAAATLLSNILHSSKALPYMGLFLVGGYDREEGRGRVFQLDPAGGILEQDSYYATGSGSQVAYGLLQDGFDESLGREEALRLALRSIKSASERDIASGDGFSVMVVNEDGCETLEDEEIDGILGGE